MIDEAGIDEKLCRRERLRAWKAGAMIVFGIPLLFVGPAVLASLFYLPAYYVARELFSSDGPGWLTLFVVLTIITIPLLIRLELRTRGDFLADALPSADVYQTHTMGGVGTFGGEMAASGAILANPRGTSSLFVEVFLFGPRILIGGLRDVRLARRVRMHDRTPVCQLVAWLLTRETGMDTNEAMTKSGSAYAHAHVLAYLVFYEWAGVAEDGSRVWLYSDARRSLKP